jgi:hypothetical protein
MARSVVEALNLLLEFSDTPGTTRLLDFKYKNTPVFFKYKHTKDRMNLPVIDVRVHNANNDLFLTRFDVYSIDDIRAFVNQCKGTSA